MKIVPYDPRFEDGIKSLCRIPVSGNISLSLEREPNYLRGASIQCETPDIYMAIDKETKSVKAIFNVGLRRLWLNGSITFVRYLCDLRIHPELQRSSLLFRLIRSYHQVAGHDQLFGQTIIFEDNLPMLKMVEHRKTMNGKLSIPFYHFAGKMVTHLIGFNQTLSTSSDIRIRRATNKDIPIMQLFADKEGSKLNYFPYYDFNQLGSSYYFGLSISDFYLAEKDGQLVGICGVWNQKDFKQTRISGYSSLFSIVRPIYNMLAPVSGLMPLPPVKTVLNYLSIHTIIIKDRDPQLFKPLLADILKQNINMGYDYVLCGLSVSDPLASVLLQLKATRKIVGNYYLVNWGDPIPNELQQDYFYLEAARI